MTQQDDGTGREEHRAAEPLTLPGLKSVIARSVRYERPPKPMPSSMPPGPAQHSLSETFRSSTANASATADIDSLHPHPQPSRREHLLHWAEPAQVFPLPNREASCGLSGAAIANPDDSC